MKKCQQQQTPKGWVCVECGAGPYPVPCSRNCGVKPGDNKPNAVYRTCPHCGAGLGRGDRKKLLRDGGKIHWWCPQCHQDCGECAGCNQQSN